ncbi:hypothetical protein [Phenylobacterium sp.]|uniref:hypothetical protein n=1 Tax=Phenylobacterium sp. TaxID=1871053 RepID=UPI0025ED8FDE|nr:hypothetical protein [Phenylobacterium sp.]MCA3719490.1 hypothetical protein [Phenylobacterium sp.]
MTLSTISEDLNLTELPRQSRVHATFIMVLLGLFVFRVAAQILQLLAPTPILPAFEAWHSGTLPYGLLFAFQIVIIILAALFVRGLWIGQIKQNRRLGTVVAWIGGLYFAGSVARFVAGLTFAKQNLFLSAHLPGIFHIVLAVMVLTVAHYHLSNITGDEA